MARGIFEQLDWLTKKVKQLCCIIENGGGGGGGECKCETIEKTKSQIDSLVSSNGLLPGRFYRISNVCPPLYGGTDIIIQAATTNTFVDDAEGFFYNPKYDNYSIWTNVMPCNILPYGYFEYNEPVVADNGATGIFLSYGMIIWTSGDWSTATSVFGLVTEAECPISGAVSPSYNIGGRVIWGGKVWENINGNVGSIDDNFNLNSDEWAIVAYNTNDYNLVVDEIKYNYENDTIYYRRSGEGTTSNIVDGYYEGGISYQGVKEFPWGNTAAVFANRVSNSKCEIINFRGSTFSFNEISQGTNLSNIISDTTSSIDWNIITDGYIGNCVLSQNSTISYNIMPLGGIYNNRLSHSSHINENNISFSSINGNFLEDGSGISINDITNYSLIQNNYVFNSDINHNKVYNYSYIQTNNVVNSTSISNNTLDTNCNIVYVNQDGYNSNENFIEYNTLLKNSNISDVSYVYIGSNNLSNYSSITYSGNNGADSLSIANNTIDSSVMTSVWAGSYGNCTVNSNILTKGSSFNSLSLQGGSVVNYNNFFNSDFVSCNINENTQFTNNTLENSNISNIIGNWGTGSGILFTTCRMYNSAIDGNTLGQIANNISNITMTDVTLNQPISGATYIYQPYSKTISLANVDGCIDPGPSPILTYISVNCLLGSSTLEIVSYTA